MKFEADIEAPKGYKFTGELRPVCQNEHYYCWHYKSVLIWKDHARSDWLYPILEKKTIVIPPNFIKSGWWIARDRDGRWWTYSCKPTIGYKSFLINGVNESCEISNFIHELELYNDIPWEETLTKQE